MEQVDTSVSPSHSFYHYANNKWIEKNSIPADKSRWSVFNVLDEASKENLKKILETVPKSSMVCKLYESGLNTVRIEEEGIKPIHDILEQIDNIADQASLWKAVASLHEEQLACPFFRIGASPDAKKSSWIAAHMCQGGLGLPDRDYYDLPGKAEIREEYVRFISRMFVNLGMQFTEAEKWAKEVMAFETEIAAVSLKMVERRDPVKTYNKRTVPELKLLAKNMDFDLIFDGIGMKDFGDLIIESPLYFEKLSNILEKTDLNIIKSYLKRVVICAAAPYLSEAFEKEHFNFYKKTLNGVQEMEPRWKRVLGVVTECVRDPVSQLYVEKHFSVEAKKAAFEMVQFIIIAFRESIENASWMQQETKEKALEKLAKFNVKIGYPEKWADFNPLEKLISRDSSYLLNIRQASRFVYKLDEIDRLNKSVDRTKWEMPPFMVNAYFHPTMNEIVFPAAILQPPFFFAPSSSKPYGDPALNFGAIGAVISHEISHGYDDQGRQYDSNGEISDWWTKEDSEAFNKRAKMMVEQFNGHEFHGEKVNGELTQGENIADLGGVAVSFVAFQKWLAKHPDFVPNSTEFSQNQCFFLSYAQVWRTLIRDEAAKQLLVVDPHSPGLWRVNGILNNIPEFHEAFGVKSGDAMYLEPENRVKIW